MASSNSNSPCAACKYLRRKCAEGCVFAPHFPAGEPQKFASVHRVFGASNVADLLKDLNTAAEREDAVKSLVYEAESRLLDSVYGCVGYISVLQKRRNEVLHDLFVAKKELAAFIGPAALGPLLIPTHPTSPNYAFRAPVAESASLTPPLDPSSS